jgi:hypothetical protein
MTIKKMSLAVIPVLALALILVLIANPDKPRKGEWDFKLTKIWEVDRAGDEVLGFPFSLMATDKGALYVFDAANNASYIFDKDGHFVRAFARRGQGPGEVLGQDRTHSVDGKIYIPAVSGIHVFTEDGEYIETVKLEVGSLNPRLFLNGDEIISAPLTAAFLPDGRGKIVRKNIRTGAEKVLSEFSLEDWGIGQSGDSVVDIVAIGFSPLMIVGYADDRLYWGMNTAYRINVTDIDAESKKAKLKQIDIFSPEGEYLYRAQVRFEGGRRPLFSPLDNLVIRNGHLFAVLTDDKDNVRLAKYGIALPDGN